MYGSEKVNARPASQKVASIEPALGLHLVFAGMD